MLMDYFLQFCLGVMVVLWLINKIYKPVLWISDTLHYKNKK